MRTASLPILLQVYMSKRMIFWLGFFYFKYDFPRASKYDVSIVISLCQNSHFAAKIYMKIYVTNILSFPHLFPPGIINNHFVFEKSAFEKNSFTFL